MQKYKELYIFAIFKLYNMNQTVLIPISKLEVNKGQLEGLPKNPRIIKDARFEALKKSIEDAPEMMHLRELLVYPLENDNYIVIGGNMRLKACQDLEYKELPCKIISKETSVEKLKEYIIKDNIAFGANDWEALNIEWERESLIDWGMEDFCSNNYIDLSAMFNEEENEEEKTDEKIVIEVILPANAEYEQDIRDLITETLQDYKEIKIK